MASRLDTQTVLTVSSTWQGDPLERNEVVWVALNRTEDALLVDLRGTLHGDPAPPGPPGRFDGLWQYEVAEVFICGGFERYLELELGPHGHYLAITHHGRRNVLSRDHELSYDAEGYGERWRGFAKVPIELVPPPPHTINAFAMHGLGDYRRYLAAYPGRGEPDFHQLETYRSIVL